MSFWVYEWWIHARVLCLPPPLWLCLLWFIFVSLLPLVWLPHYSADMPSLFMPQGPCTGYICWLELPFPQIIAELTLTAFKSLLKCRLFQESLPLPCTSIIWPTLMDIFLFLAFIVVWHTTYLPTDCSSSPPQNVRVWRQELFQIRSLQLPRHLGRVFTEGKMD